MREKERDFHSGLSINCVTWSVKKIRIKIKNAEQLPQLNRALASLHDPMPHVLKQHYALKTNLGRDDSYNENHHKLRKEGPTNNLIFSKGGYWYA